MKKTRLRSAACALILLSPILLVKAVSAALVSYDEVVDGEISEIASDLLLNFDVGVNTISGSAELSSTSSGTTVDRDTFTIIIPSSTEIISATYHYSNVNILPGTGSWGIFPIIFEQPSNTVAINGGINFISDTSPLSLTGFLPLGDGVYTTSFGGSISGGSGDRGGTWDYTWSIEVAAIPIPAAAWLFGSGLLGLAGVARRKKAA